MAIFNVLTESGADYLIDTTDGFWYHRGRNMGRLFVFQAANIEDCGLPWDHQDNWDDVTEPVIGQRMYLSAMSEWRISTPVKSYIKLV